MQCVLIVDDIAENRYFLEVLLKGSGFAVCSAANGAEALESARNDPPDLIVSDILMPVMDGYTLCRECKADDRLRRIPFIFYTATYTEKKDQALAYRLGADQFVVKPQEPEVLLSLISEVLAAPREGGGRSPAEEPRREEELLREYNDVLFHKLEKKMADLEQANRELERKIIEQKRTEEQLRQAQKLEAIGRFSAEISHDFNNIMAVIVGYAHLVQMHLAKDDQQRERMDQILAVAERARNLTRSLLAFSRKEELKLELIDLNAGIGSVETLLRSIIGEGIALMVSLRGGRVPIIADQGHIEQVLINLATNARDAMPKGGILSIGTDICDVDEAFIDLHGFASPGRYAVITVADSGIGMDAVTRQRIFEPFFTTKESGQGTGLGLSIIYGVVRQHNGHITVYSEPGQGTTFRIYLPLTQGDAGRGSGSASPRQAPCGSETLLIVDDEAPIREYLKLYLAELGYRVFLARDGQEAVDLFRERMHEIDLVLLDVILPGKNGREVAGEIRKMRNNSKIVFTSGYPYNLVCGRNLLEEGEQLLVKPLTPTELAVTLRAVLDGHATI